VGELALMPGDSLEREAKATAPLSEVPERDAPPAAETEEAALPVLWRSCGPFSRGRTSVASGSTSMALAHLAAPERAQKSAQNSFTDWYLDSTSVDVALLRMASRLDPQGCPANSAGRPLIGSRIN